jgi:hypothetical protein
VVAQRLSELGSVPPLGEWFDALCALIRNGDPPLQETPPT